MRLNQNLQRFLRLPDDQHIDPEVRRNFKPNAINNSLDVIFWLLGESFVSVSTILPVFASTLTDSTVLIGLVPALINAGWFIPQLLMAGYVQRLPLKMPFARSMAVVERIPYIILPLTAFILRWISKDLALVFFILVIAWRGLASGMVALPWQEVIATVIPSPVRSRFFGVSRTFGRILGVVGSVVTSLILGKLAYPNNYALSFLIGAIFIWTSYFFFVKTIEPNSNTSGLKSHQEESKKIFSDLSAYKNILKQDTNFVRYLISRAMFQMGGMATAFLAVFGIQNYQLTDDQAAIFTGLIFISGTLAFIFLSMIGDRIGPRQTLIISDILHLGVLFLAFSSPGVWSIYIIFLILGFAQSSYVLGELIIAMELGPEEERPIYIGLARTLPGILILIAPLIGGVLVGQFGYRVMFLVAIGFSLAGIVILLGVKDRKRLNKTKAS